MRGSPKRGSTLLPKCVSALIRCADVFGSPGRGAGLWLWRLMPFTVRNAAGWPIIRLLLHRPVLQRIPVRRHLGVRPLTAAGGGPRRGLEAARGAAGYVDTTGWAEWAHLR